MASELREAEHREQTVVGNKAATNRSSDESWGLSSNLDVASERVTSKTAFSANPAEACRDEGEKSQETFLEALYSTATLTAFASKLRDTSTYALV